MDWLRGRQSETPDLSVHLWTNDYNGGPALGVSNRRSLNVTLLAAGIITPSAVVSCWGGPGDPTRPSLPVRLEARGHLTIELLPEMDGDSVAPLGAGHGAFVITACGHRFADVRRLPFLKRRAASRALRQWQRDL